MDEFLDQVILDNTIRSYLVVAGIITFVLLVKTYVAHYLASILFEFVKAVWKDVDKKSFRNLVSKPLGTFLAILVSIVSLYKLNFPTVFDVDVYRFTLKELLHTLASLVLIISFIRLLLRIIDFIAHILTIKADLTHDTTDNQLVVFFKDFFKVMIGIVGFLMILKFSFGYKITNLLTGLSIVGAAIALALRESLENLIASFIIFFDKPFSMGDVVKVQSYTGTVEKIGLRSTRIRTDQKTFITVPNKQMVDTILDNHSMRTQRKGELKLEISPNTDSEKIDRLVAGIRKITTREDIETSNVFLSDITATAFMVQVDYFTGPITAAEFNSVKEQVNFQILRLMESLQVELAGANTDVRLTQTVTG
jgi:Small-conductance mechanosensitive channel